MRPLVAGHTSRTAAGDSYDLWFPCGVNLMRWPEPRRDGQIDAAQAGQVRQSEEALSA